MSGSKMNSVVGRLFFLLMIFSVFFFQNCSSFEKYSFNFYPYETKPDFFYDLQIIGVQVDELNRKEHLVDFAISYGADPRQSVDYNIQFSTLDAPHVCPEMNGTAEGDEKHFRGLCLIPLSSKNLFIRLTLTGPENEILERIFEVTGEKIIEKNEN